MKLFIDDFYWDGCINDTVCCPWAKTTIGWYCSVCREPCSLSSLSPLSYSSLFWLNIKKKIDKPMSEVLPLSYDKKAGISSTWRSVDKQDFFWQM